MKYNIAIATHADYPAIAALLRRYEDKMTITSDYFNRRDIALKAELDSKIVGFIWCGLMAKGKVGYIDKFVVSPEHTKAGVGHALSQRLLTECVARKVVNVQAVVRHDAWLNSSAMNALKMKMGADRAQYSFIYADIKSLQGTT